MFHTVQRLIGLIDSAPRAGLTRIRHRHEAEFPPSNRPPTGSLPSPQILLAALILLLGLPMNLPATTTDYRLENGLEVILKENHSSPMIASVIFVKSGSKYESRFENGITHFLEHLLFDGTVNLSRLELDESISHLGGYINAFTRKDGTVYLVLLPKQYIDYGLTVQADMLFNSIFPLEELAKERKVVTEEIKQDLDAPNAAVEFFHAEKSLEGTEYDRPILGHESFIANIPREAIVDYWKRFYRPGNMTALIIGDFETAAMKEQVAAVFGSIPDTVGPTLDTLRPVCEPSDPPVVAVWDTVAAVTGTHINLSIAAPSIYDSGFYAFDLLAQYLAMEDVSPLIKALTQGEPPLATEVSVGLSPYDSFSRLEVSVTAEGDVETDTIIATILEQLAGIGHAAASPETIDGLKTSVKTNDIYYAEKLHYYAFIIAPQMMTGGWEFVQTYADRIAATSWEQCQQAARRWLTNPSLVASVVRPADSGQTPYEPIVMAAPEVTGHFRTASIAEYDLSRGYPLTFPATDSVRLELTDAAAYHREVLDNGAIVIIKSSSDSRVFAMNVLGKNRTINEPAGKEGITDFVNHMIEKGTLTRSASELSRDLARIGANVTLYDNPWIPYDDRYTSRRFSFMKFETIEEFARKAFFLFAEMVLHPSFDSSEVENVRRSMLMPMRRSGDTPKEVARQAFYETLFDHQPYGRAVAGTPQSIGSITCDDLREHHNRFYAPGNLIIAIGTTRPVEQVMDWVKEAFGCRREADAATLLNAATPPAPLTESKIAHEEMQSEQISIYFGAPVPGANDKDAVTLEVAATVLSHRLYRNLREVRGLAYSVGTGINFDRDFGWYYNSIATGNDNYQTAIDGIILEIEKLRLDGPTHDELNGARNSIWGRLSSARLSRINQAYYLAVDEYLGRPLGYDQRFVDMLQAITPDDIRRVAARYFTTDVYVLASAGKKE